MSAAAVQVGRRSLDEAAAIDAAYAVLEAGKALRLAKRAQDELDTAARRHQDNVLEPAQQRFHQAQAKWRAASAAAAGTELEVAS